MANTQKFWENWPMLIFAENEFQNFKYTSNLSQIFMFLSPNTFLWLSQILTLLTLLMFNSTEQISSLFSKLIVLSFIGPFRPYLYFILNYLLLFICLFNYPQTFHKHMELWKKKHLLVYWLPACYPHPTHSFYFVGCGHACLGGTNAVFPNKVFELGPILPTLTKLEGFLCQNHHLWLKFD